jgi:hypothetical protein
MEIDFGGVVKEYAVSNVLLGGRRPIGLCQSRRGHQDRQEFAIPAAPAFLGRRVRGDRRLARGVG